MEVIRKALWAFRNECLNLINKEIEKSEALFEEQGFIGLNKNRLLFIFKGLKKNIQSLPTDPKTLIASYNQKFAKRKKSKTGQE